MCRIFEPSSPAAVLGKGHPMMPCWAVVNSLTRPMPDPDLGEDLQQVLS